MAKTQFSCKVIWINIFLNIKIVCQSSFQNTDISLNHMVILTQTSIATYKLFWKLMKFFPLKKNKKIKNKEEKQTNKQTEKLCLKLTWKRILNLHLKNCYSNQSLKPLFEHLVSILKVETNIQVDCLHLSFTFHVLVWTSTAAVDPRHLKVEVAE